MWVLEEWSLQESRCWLLHYFSLRQLIDANLSSWLLSLGLYAHIKSGCTPVTLSFTQRDFTVNFKLRLNSARIKSARIIIKTPPVWVVFDLWLALKTVAQGKYFTIKMSGDNQDYVPITTSVLRHKAGQEGRGEILLENSSMRWWCYQGKIMHTTSNTFSVLYVLKKHRQHINNTMKPPTLLFLASWPSYTRASCHSKIISIRINLRVSCSRCTSTSQK